MEATKDKLNKELVEKQKQMEADALLNERLRKMREKNDEQQEQINEIERQRYTMQVDQQISAQKRQIDEIQRKINEQREIDRKLAEQESQFAKDQALESQENFNTANKVSKHITKPSVGGKIEEPS